MKVLLDTPTLLCSVINPEPLSRRASEIISDEENAILVSAASAWEIAAKVRLGKLPRAQAFERGFLDVLDGLGYSVLAIDAEIALRAGSLPGGHGDPFDRMISAQAVAIDISVISIDAKLNAFGVQRIW